MLNRRVRSGHGSAMFVRFNSYVTNQMKEIDNPQFINSLKLFHEREGHYTVPTNFVIPDQAIIDVAMDPSLKTLKSYDKDSTPWPAELVGYPLGQHMLMFTRGRFGDQKKQLLASIGFPYHDWKLYIWHEQVRPGILTHNQIYGHTFVKQTFTVPFGDERWPRSTWGVKLGNFCGKLRRDLDRQQLPSEQYEELTRIDFVWNVQQMRWKAFTLPSLITFKQIFGHLEIPHKFIVPVNDALWDKDQTMGDSSQEKVKLGNYKLGLALQSIKEDPNYFISFETAVNELRDLGYETARQDAETSWVNILLPSLETYSSIHRHDEIIEIPPDFIVPSTTPWPEATWGTNLGYIVERIKDSSVFEAQLAQSSRRRKLRSLGYYWPILCGKWEALPALKVFYKLHGHTNVPITYKVPSPTSIRNEGEVSPWPKALHGVKLGKAVSTIKKNGRDHPEVECILEDLDEINFNFNLIDLEFEEQVMPALEMYVATYGHCYVPSTFIIPHREPWPKHLAGFRLGYMVQGIRARKKYVKQVEQHQDRLKDLGFEWRERKIKEEVRKEIVLPCIKLYKQLYGEDAEICSTFVVPNDAIWPKESWGFNLGRWIKVDQREKEKLALRSLEQVAPKVPPGANAEELSTCLEQYWKEVLLGAFQTYALHHGSCSHMPRDFRVPQEDLYPQGAWGLNLELRMRHIRRGVRYQIQVENDREQLKQLGVLE